MYFKYCIETDFQPLGKEKMNGQKRFTVDEWLQPSQVLSFFSRLSLLSRKGKHDGKSVK